MGNTTFKLSVKRKNDNKLQCISLAFLKKRISRYDTERLRFSIDETSLDFEEDNQIINKIPTPQLNVCMHEHLQYTLFFLFLFMMILKRDGLMHANTDILIK